MKEEILEVEEEKDLSSCATNEEINRVLNFIENNFETLELSSVQLDNSRKLSSYLTKTKIDIEELESEILLEKSSKLNFMFNVLSSSQILVRVNNYSNLITLLDIYCQKNNVEQTTDIEVELYNRESNNDLDLFKLYLTEIGQYKILTPEEERELAIKAFNGDINSRHKLVEHNLRLVIPIAKRYQGAGLSLNELVLYGNEGITIASQRFDPSRNCRFSTYATWWIKQCIQRGLREIGRTITVPNHIYEQIVRVKRETAKHVLENNGEMPSNEYLAEKLNLTPEKILLIKKNMEPIVSLSTPLGEESNDSTLGDMIEDDHSEIEEMIDTMISAEISIKLLNSKRLTDREREIIKMRFGFYGEEKTLEEIGQMYNLSRERIRQIEKVALKKILRATKTLGLARYINKNNQKKTLSK